MFAIFCGIAFGIAQFALLKMVTNSVLSGKKTFFAFLLIKLALYASAICLLWFVFKAYIMLAGIGLGIGIIGCSFCYFLYIIITTKKPKGDE